jgi:PAS domain S-box-containing protein
MQNAFRRFFYPPIFEDEEKTRVARFLNNFSWVAISVIVVLILSRIFDWTDESIIPVIILFAVIILLLVMQEIVRRGNVRGATIFLVISLWILMTILAWSADGLHDLSLIAYLVVIILASLLMGWRFALFMGIVSLVSIWYFGISEKMGLRPMHVDDPISYARDLTGIFILIGILIYLLIDNWTLTLQSARRELKERLRAEQKLQRQADYLSALHETAVGLLSRSDLKSLLASILERACDLIGTQNGLIELILPDGSAMRQEIGRGVLAKFDGYLTEKGRGVTGMIWETEKPLAIQDYSLWKNSIPEFVASGVRSIMGVPLKVGGEVIGVIAVFHVEAGGMFTQEQVNLMERFAALAALAIHNTRLNEQAESELHERKMAELALRASEERFRKVFQASPVAICITTLDEGKIVEANKAYWKLSDYDSDYAGHTVLELQIWQSTETRQAFIDRLVSERSIYNPEYVFYTSTREIRSTIAFFELIEIKGQTCILSMFLDITEQLKAQTALSEAEARTRALLTAIPDMIFQLSSDGVFLDFIPSSESKPLVPPEEFLGKTIGNTLPGYVEQQALKAIERAIETGQMETFEYEITLSGPTEFFEARVVALNSKSVLAMVRNISQRKWVEAEREKLIHDLEDKNAELERFTYTVSHDLKAPLITIKGFLGFLEEDAISGNITRLKSDIKRIGDATEKMRSLLNELLELSRVGRLMNESESIPFNEIAQEAVELVQGRIMQKGIRVRIQKDMPVVYGDRPRLVEVMQNLVDNAAKFIGDQPEPLIEILQQGEENGMPIFVVCDNGIGIEPEHFDRIFGIFNKLDGNSEGTGIGLALVKRIIEIHRGRIWVESEAGKGTTFRFTLQTGPAS